MANPPGYPPVPLEPIWVHQSPGWSILTGPVSIWRGMMQESVRNIRADLIMMMGGGITLDSVPDHTDISQIRILDLVCDHCSKSDL